MTVMYIISCQYRFRHYYFNKSTHHLNTYLHCCLRCAFTALSGQRLFHIHNFLEEIKNIFLLYTSSGPIMSPPLQSISVPGDRENNCTCSEISSSAVIAVSAVSLLLIVTLITVILTQCLLIIRLRKFKDVLHRNETYAEVMTSTTMHTDVPVTPNEAYALHNMTSSTKEVTYELVK